MYETLRDVRYKNGDLTQKEMADKIGISVGAYSLIESGKRVGSTKTWLKIQELFNLTDEEVWRLQTKKERN
ncbi:MAG: helix-turn-helix transcriptional regulator [Bacillus sp. (in: Bacteria)]|nr:helix-turn-helix transcriptional regulator [Bacillus sp. (in: firmicutes)]